jgi:hypothetical protein
VCTLNNNDFRLSFQKKRIHGVYTLSSISRIVGKNSIITTSSRAHIVNSMSCAHILQRAASFTKHKHQSTFLVLATGGCALVLFQFVTWMGVSSDRDSVCPAHTYLRSLCCNTDRMPVRAKECARPFPDEIVFCETIPALMRLRSYWQEETSGRSVG